MKDFDSINLSAEIIEVFEDFLDERGVTIPYEPSLSEDEDEIENAGIIFGEDYFDLEDSIRNVLDRWEGNGWKLK